MEETEKTTAADLVKTPSDDDKPKVSSLILEAKETAERIEKANEVMAKQIKKMEELAATNALMGRARAGQTEIPETEHEKWVRSAKERYKGTGMDPT